MKCFSLGGSLSWLFYWIGGCFFTPFRFSCRNTFCSARMMEDRVGWERGTGVAICIYSS